MKREDSTELIDKVISNPSFDRMGGYHIFFRRVAIPLLLFIIGLLIYSILENFLTHDTNIILTCIIVGLSIGPILNLERYYGMIRSNGK
tara:strand:+ start:530 stop:796 length:267 start_codon:yes stop_codon:yes gene_type:complete